MVRSLLDQEIRQLREKLLQMGSLVETAIDRAVTALKHRDVTLAQSVVEGDEQINRLRHEIEELCIETIATQQPMAIDLRMIFAITHIAVELERMGDHAAGIAKLVLRIADQPLLKPLIDIPLMAKADREMICGALDAFVKQDAARAREVAQRDDEVDQLYQQVFRELLTYMMEDPRNITRATYLLWVAHVLERIGDRATNICERVVFIVTGQFTEFTADHHEEEPA